MNLHISEDQFKSLKESTILSIRMGSRLYGAETATSDTDILHIFAKGKDMEHSFVWTHHNFQYKEEGVDHVFTSLQNFISNLLKGDSTINYECLFSKEMASSTELKWLYDFREEFKGYALLRSYLGLARRDLKQYSQNYDTKKLFHALRGIWTYELIRKNMYKNEFKEIDSDYFDFLMSIRLGKIDKMESIKLMKSSGEKVEELRKSLSEELQSGKIARVMDSVLLEKLDRELVNYCTTTNYKEKQKDKLIISEVYATLESDIKYD